MPDVLDGLEPERSAPRGVGGHDGVGVAPINMPQADYFGFAATERMMLPDGVSWLDLKILNEGERRRYQNESNREIKLGRGSSDSASLRMRPGDDRHVLLKMSITGWNLQRNGNVVPFNTVVLDQFLLNADPSLVDRIEKRIRQLNPWLLSEMTVEQIDEEIRSLQEMREVRAREEEGNVTSSNK